MSTVHGIIANGFFNGSVFSFLYLDLKSSAHLKDGQVEEV